MITDSAVTEGMPLWADVSAVDPLASGDYYAGLFGWSYETHPDPDGGKYALALLDGVPVAGLRQQQDDGAGPTPGWTVHLATADVAAAEAKVGRMGGRVLGGPSVLPWCRSTRLLVADSTGATIGFRQPGEAFTARLHEPGTLWWVELTSTDVYTSDEFYKAFFPYERSAFNGSWYSVWRLGGTPYLGRLPQAIATASFWMPYFIAPTGGIVESAAARSVELGGTVRREPFDHTHGRAAVLTDRDGAAFTVLEVRRPAQ